MSIYSYFFCKEEINKINSHVHSVAPHVCETTFVSNNKIKKTFISISEVR